MILPSWYTFSGEIGSPQAARHPEHYPEPASEKDVKLAQKLGQLQLFLVVLPQTNAWAILHLLGQTAN
jgi:hypothetical protein